MTRLLVLLALCACAESATPDAGVRRPVAVDAGGPGMWLPSEATTSQLVVTGQTLTYAKVRSDGTCWVSLDGGTLHREESELCTALHRALLGDFAGRGE